MSTPTLKFYRPSEEMKKTILKRVSTNISNEYDRFLASNFQHGICVLRNKDVYEKMFRDIWYNSIRLNKKYEAIEYHKYYDRGCLQYLLFINNDYNEGDGICLEPEKFNELFRSIREVGIGLKLYDDKDKDSIPYNKENMEGMTTDGIAKLRGVFKSKFTTDSYRKEFGECHLNKNRFLNSTIKFKTIFDYDIIVHPDTAYFYECYENIYKYEKYLVYFKETQNTNFDKFTVIVLSGSEFNYHFERASKKQIDDKFSSAAQPKIIMPLKSYCISNSKGKVRPLKPLSCIDNKGFGISLGPDKTFKYEIKQDNYGNKLFIYFTEDRWVEYSVTPDIKDKFKFFTELESWEEIEKEIDKAAEEHGLVEKSIWDIPTNIYR